MNALAQVKPEAIEPSEKYDGLLVDALMLLEDKRSAHMPTWAYMNGGRPYLENFFKSEFYDGTREAELIPDLATSFIEKLPSEISLIELGPGANYDKTSSFIRAFNEASKGEKRIVQYCGLDFVADYAFNAADHISREFRITTNGIVEDFTKIRGPIQTLATPVLVSWNSPIWNSAIDPSTDSDYTYASTLRRIGHLVGPKGSVILTHFPAKNAQATEEIYNRDDCRLAVLAIPALIERVLTPECTSKADGTSLRFSEIFDYKATYDPNVECVSMNLVPKLDCTVKISNASIDLQKGKSLEMVRSAKPSVGRFHKISGLAQGEIIDNAKSKDGTVVGHLLKFQSL